MTYLYRCPLPWCQGEAEECDSVEAFVKCTKCGASSDTFSFMKNAVEQWNERDELSGLQLALKNAKVITRHMENIKVNTINIPLNGYALDIGIIACELVKLYEKR